VHEVSWGSLAYYSDVTIKFSSDGGGDWSVVDSYIADTGNYMWNTPNDVNSDECLISVVPADGDPNVIVTESGLFEVHPDSPDVDVESVWESLGGDYSRRGLL
jgi:hypothetical protein